MMARHNLQGWASFQKHSLDWFGSKQSSFRENIINLSSTQTFIMYDLNPVWLEPSLTTILHLCVFIVHFGIWSIGIQCWIGGTWNFHINIYYYYYFTRQDMIGCVPGDLMKICIGLGCFKNFHIGWWSLEFPCPIWLKSEFCSTFITVCWVFHVFILFPAMPSGYTETNIDSSA